MCEFTSGGRILQMPVFSAMGRILLINPKGSEKSSQLGSNTGHSGGGTNSANADMLWWCQWNSPKYNIWSNAPSWAQQSMIISNNFRLDKPLCVHHDRWNLLNNKSHQWQAIAVAMANHDQDWKWMHNHKSNNRADHCFLIIHEQRARSGRGVFSTTPLPGTEGRVSPKSHHTYHTRQLHDNQLRSEDLGQGRAPNLNRSLWKQNKILLVYSVSCDVMLALRYAS